jgi:hypothetical protein
MQFYYYLFLTKGIKMKLSKEEFWKMNEIDSAISVVEDLAKILLDYNGEKSNLINILHEKIAIMTNKFDDFISCLIKQ